MIRYDSKSNEVLQCIVNVDEDGSFHEEYSVTIDPHLTSYLRFIKQMSLLENNNDSLSSRWSIFEENLVNPEFIPTNGFRLMELITKKFPLSKIIMSDFDSLPNAILGKNAPVVQTRYRNLMVPCRTYLVQPGYFDIFFPTNFQMLKKIYSSLDPHKNVTVMKHREFLSKYLDLEKTNTQSGENPVLQYYENVSFLISE